VKPFTGPLSTLPPRRLGAAGGLTGLDATRTGAGGPEPGFLVTVAIVFFPDGLGWNLGAAGFDETFLALVCLADFPAFADGFCADLSLALLERLVAAGAFLTSFFLLAGAFFLVAAFLADMALASKTARKEPAIIQTLGGSGRGSKSHFATLGNAMLAVGRQPRCRCSATTDV
jgi:hypothetical protein